MGKLKLTVNEEKTRICKVPEGEFDFLGYTFGRMYSARTGQARIGYRPSKKSSCLGRLPGAPGRSSRSLSAASSSVPPSELGQLVQLELRLSASWRQSAEHLGSYADIGDTYDAITAYPDEKGIPCPF